MTRQKPWLSETVLLLVFLIPLIVVLTITDLYPLAFSSYLSFTSWSLIDRGASASWVGLSNFRTVFNDVVFRDSFVTSLKYSLSATSVQLVLGLAIAYMVVGESKWMRVIRTILLIPMFVPGVVVGTIWRMMLNVNAGIVNHLLRTVGVAGLIWFSSPQTALNSTVLVDIWYMTPFVMIIWVGGITTLPPEVIRAARVDGASRWQIFTRIMLPLLAPVIIDATLFRFIGSFFVLDHIYTTTYGGPGFTTNMVSFYLYRQGLSHFKLSYVAAASWYMIGFALIVVLVLRTLRRLLETRRSTR
jgi:ABC-type sugar transport system permease subunit